MFDLQFLYRQTRSMRADLLAFLAPLPGAVLSASLPGSGQGSLLSTLAHVADCYGGWVGRTLPEEDWASVR
jgi:uncharacterized damage-inducible protein DinB